MKRKYKNYKERAEYLADIFPSKRNMFEAIALFFGEEEIPPIPKSIQKSPRKIK